MSKMLQMLQVQMLSIKCEMHVNVNRLKFKLFLQGSIKHWIKIQGFS